MVTILWCVFGSHSSKKVRSGQNYPKSGKDEWKTNIANNHELVVAHESKQKNSTQDIIQNLKFSFHKLSSLGCESMHDPTQWIKYWLIHNLDVSATPPFYAFEFEPYEPLSKNLLGHQKFQIDAMISQCLIYIENCFSLEGSTEMGVSTLKISNLFNGEWLNVKSIFLLLE